MTVERNLRIFDKSALQRQTKYQSKIGWEIFVLGDHLFPGACAIKLITAVIYGLS